jgi:hypothetical protein
MSFVNERALDCGACPITSLLFLVSGNPRPREVLRRYFIQVDNARDAGDGGSVLQDTSLRVPVKKQINRVTNVHIPMMASYMRPPDEPDAQEDWADDVLALFEWVGMACLGAQR